MQFALASHQDFCLNIEIENFVSLGATPEKIMVYHNAWCLFKVIQEKVEIPIITHPFNQTTYPKKKDEQCLLYLFLVLEVQFPDFSALEAKIIFTSLRKKPD